MCDLFGPLGVSGGVGWAIEAGKKLSGQFGPSLFVKAQCLGQDCGGCLSHDGPILRFD